MKISDTFEDAVNRQINSTMTASYHFLQISAWFETTPFKGFAKWMLRQSDREQTNAMKLYRYVKDRIGFVELMPIDKPDKSYDSPLDAFRAALRRIHTLVGTFHELHALAVEEEDFETQELVYGFVGDLVVEEKNMQDLIGKLEVADGDPDALLHMDYVQEKEA